MWYVFVCVIFCDWELFRPFSAARIGSFSCSPITLKSAGYEFYYRVERIFRSCHVLNFRAAVRNNWCKWSVSEAPIGDSSRMARSWFWLMKEVDWVFCLFLKQYSMCSYLKWKQFGRFETLQCLVHMDHFWLKLVRDGRKRMPEVTQKLAQR